VSAAKLSAAVTDDSVEAGELLQEVDAVLATAEEPDVELPMLSLEGDLDLEIIVDLK